MLPQDLKYAKTHEWVHFNGDETAKIGITYHAQESLGDITFVELPEVGASFDSGQPFGVIESVKAASDLYMPISGEIVAVNSDLEESPETINASPYEEGWLIKIKVHDPRELHNLLPPQEYEQLL